MSSTVVISVALGVPDTEVRDPPNSPFAHALELREGASDLDTVLRHLGRSPDSRPDPISADR